MEAAWSSAFCPVPRSGPSHVGVVVRLGQWETSCTMISQMMRATKVLTLVLPIATLAAGCSGSPESITPSRSAVHSTPRTTVVTATPSLKAVSLTATAVRTYKPTDDNDYLLPTFKITKVHHGGSCVDASNTIGSAGFRCYSADNESSTRAFQPSSMAPRS